VRRAREGRGCVAGELQGIESGFYETRFWGAGDGVAGDRVLRQVLSRFETCVVYAR